MGPPGAVSWTIIGLALVIASFSRSSGGACPRARSRAGLDDGGDLQLVADWLSLRGRHALLDSHLNGHRAADVDLHPRRVSVGLMLAIPERGPMRLFDGLRSCGRARQADSPRADHRAGRAGLRPSRGRTGRAVRPGVRHGLPHDLQRSRSCSCLLWWTASAISRQTERAPKPKKSCATASISCKSTWQTASCCNASAPEIIREGDDQSLYDTIIDAAIVIMQSRYASMQIFDPETPRIEAAQRPRIRRAGDRALEVGEHRLDEHLRPGAATGERVIVSDVLDVRLPGGHRRS